VRKFYLPAPSAWWLLFFAFCSPRIAKTQCPITVNAGPDQFFCSSPATTQLDGQISGAFINFNWSPTTGMSGANTLTPTVTVSQSQNYVLRARASDPSQNLIENGDFESGNTGFTSDYVYNPGFTLPPFGSYEVTSTPAIFPDCPDHTSGSGDYLVVDGAAVPNLLVWCQTVAVTPNTDYQLSAWATSFTTGGPFALLEFTINGNVVGAPLSVPPPQCQWNPFNTVWNSGSNSSATICIENLTVTGSNNDFAIDDIYMSGLCTVTDTVRIEIINLLAVANPALRTIPCAGSPITLDGSGSSTGPNITYLWETYDGNIVSGATTLQPIVDQPGIYTLTVTYNYGSGVCTRTRDVTVVLSSNPLNVLIAQPPPLGCGAASVNITAQATQGAVNFSWTTPDGNIVSGSNSATAVVNQPGTYLVTATNFITGCTATSQTTVVATNSPPVAIAHPGDTITCLSPTSTADGSGSSTGPTISYQWSTPNGSILSGQNTLIATVGSGGTYILAVYNASNNCEARDTTVVLSDTIRPILTLHPPGELNCLEDTLQLQVVSVPTAVTAAWTSTNGGVIATGAQTLHPTVIASGTYTLIATDTLNGCSQSIQAIISTDTIQPIAAAAPGGILTCQQTSLTLSGLGSSTGPSIRYKWKSLTSGNIVSGDTTLNPVVNAPGAYLLTVTNFLNGCTDTAVTSVLADANVITVVANAPDTLTCLVNSVSLNAVGTSNIPGLLFNWSAAPGQPGNILSGADTPNPVVSAGATYVLVVSNPATGCTGSDLATVVQDTATPPITVLTPDTITCSQPLQTINASNPVNAPFTYLWIATNGGNIVSGENTLTPTINAAGTYQLLATNNSSGCTLSLSVSAAAAIGTPVADIASPPTLNCLQDTISLSGAASTSGPGINYAWSTPDGNIASGGNSIAPAVTEPGIYTLLVTNSTNGCTAQAVAVVSEDRLHPVAQSGNSAVLNCTSPQAILSVNTSGNFPQLINWTTPNGNIVGDPGQSQIAVDAPGLYLFVVTNANNGCATTDTVIVTAEFEPPAISVTLNESLTCKRDTALLGVESPPPGLFQYLWSTNAGPNPFAGPNNQSVVNILLPGDYTVTVVNTLNGCTNTKVLQVAADLTPPAVAVVDTVTVNCIAPQVTLLAAAPPHTTAEWTTSTGNILAGGNTFSPVINLAGVYLLTVTDTLNGCSTQATSIALSDIIPPSAQAGPDAAFSCLQPTAFIQGMSGTNGFPIIEWFLNGALLPANNGLLQFSTTTPGIYTLRITDSSNGCSSSDDVLVEDKQDYPDSVGIATPQALTCSRTQVELVASGNNPTGGYSFLWTPLTGGSILSGAAAPTAMVNTAGDYAVIVTDNTSGCSDTAIVTVVQDILPPALFVAPPPTLTCALPSVQISAGPALPGVDFSWQGNGVSGANTPTPTVNAPGIYTVLATNTANGCSATSFALVALDTTAPVFNLPPPALITCSNPQATLFANALVPTSGVSFLWSTGNGNLSGPNNTPTTTASAAGIYTLTVTNAANGCSRERSVEVQVNIVQPVANIQPPTAITCSQSTTVLNSLGSAGQGPLQFSWSTTNGSLSGPTNGSLATATRAGLYTLIVTDTDNGCTDETLAAITLDTVRPLLLLQTALPINCLRDSSVLTANGSATGTNFPAQWFDDTGSPLPNQSGLRAVVNQAGTYRLVLTNASNGCTATATVAVIANTAPPNLNPGTGRVLHCNQMTVNLNASSADPGVLFSWTTPDGNILSGVGTSTPLIDAIGTYFITATHPTTGCTASESVQVTRAEPPSFEFVADTPTCQLPYGRVQIQNVSGEPPFTYALDGGVVFQSSPTFSDLEPITYFPVVRDVYGCTAFSTIIFDPLLPPTVELPLFIRVELGGNGVQLFPETVPPPNEIISWQWTNEPPISCTNCPNPIVNPPRTETYTVIVTDRQGCTGSSSVQVRVDPTRYVYTPNVFTPDGDGENDRFMIFGRNVSTVEIFQVFDRWGELVFDAKNIAINDLSAGWDGRYRGNAPFPGVYVWQALLRFGDGEADWYKGDVTIIR
jgi:gliding motility-associated-like protein